jgi:branched-chain amino acid transport system substrate-binding protein
VSKRRWAFNIPHNDSNTDNQIVPQGIIKMRPLDQVGLDQRSRVMGKIRGNKFTYAYGD